MECIKSRLQCLIKLHIKELAEEARKLAPKAVGWITLMNMILLLIYV